jgi:peptidoglycan/LPS O-acetylase OafA/YrhL
VNVFFGYPWLSPVFWTLAIEVQYYVLVGLIFPLIASDRMATRIALFGGLAGLTLALPQEPFVFHWLPLFMLGMLTFQYRARIISQRQFWSWALSLFAMLCLVHSTAVAATALGTALTIAFLDLGPKHPLLIFGQLSYSLYLLHVPIGGRVVNLGERFATSLIARITVPFAALAISLLAAWLLYRFVEQPAQRWSSAIRYRHTRPAPELGSPA